LAQALARRVDALPLWQRVAPVSLNVVCFRLQGTDLPPDTLDALHADLVADVHESGAAVPSTTRIGGRLCIRVALVNHRTVPGDLDVLLDALHTAVRQRMPSLSFA
jgi:glutamate/tyrosine decarboxylase-like PLP-dependent enzyme